MKTLTDFTLRDVWYVVQWRGFGPDPEVPRFGYISGPSINVLLLWPILVEVWYA